MNNKSKKDDQKYKKKLTTEQFRVTRKGGTEIPFSGEYCNVFAKGIY